MQPLAPRVAGMLLQLLLSMAVLDERRCGVILTTQWEDIVHRALRWPGCDVSDQVAYIAAAFSGTGETMRHVDGVPTSWVRATAHAFATHELRTCVMVCDGVNRVAAADQGVRQCPGTTGPTASRG
jgi:hypothetical protein